MVYCLNGILKRVDVASKTMIVALRWVAMESKVVELKEGDERVFAGI
jgi:hypothetical protein